MGSIRWAWGRPTPQGQPGPRPTPPSRPCPVPGGPRPDHGVEGSSRVWEPPGRCPAPLPFVRVASSAPAAPWRRVPRPGPRSRSLPTAASAPRTHPSPTTTHLMACMGAGQAGGRGREPSCGEMPGAAAAADPSRAPSRAAGDSRAPPSAGRGDSRARRVGGAGLGDAAAPNAGRAGRGHRVPGPERRAWGREGGRRRERERALGDLRARVLFRERIPGPALQPEAAGVCSPRTPPGWQRHRPACCGQQSVGRGHSATPWRVFAAGCRRRVSHPD